MAAQGEEQVDMGFDIPRISEVCDEARKEFQNFFTSSPPGPKDLVIQSKELMTLLEHIAPMKTLRRCVKMILISLIIFL